MAGLLSPIVSLMDRLSYQKKMIIVAAVFLVPLCVTTFQVINASREVISATENEQVGVVYIKLLRNLQQHLAEHRYLASVVISKKSGTDVLNDKNSEIEKDISAIDDATKQYESTLGVGSRWAMVKSSWEKTKNVTGVSADESKKAHDALIHDVLYLYDTVSAASGMILDPERDTIQLVLALIGDLPQAAEHGGQVRYYGMTFLTATRALTFDEKAGMLVEFEEAKNALKSAGDDITDVIETNPDMTDMLQAPIADAQQQNDKLLATVRKEIIEEDWNITANEYKDMSAKAVASFFALFDKSAEALETLLAKRLQREGQRMTLTIGLVIVSLGVVMYFFMGFYRSAIQSIEHLVRASRQVSGGDLCGRVTHISGDELGAVAKSFNEMTDKFRSIIQQMAETSQHLSTSAAELSKVTHDSETSVHDQKTEFDLVATAVTEMSATTQEVARNAAAAAVSAEQADRNVAEGQRVIKEAMDAINKLAAQVEDATHVIQNLEKESESIGGVLSIIDGIAEQTNLLALNAAIEAARAGEQGRGFAVVADEVRTLAQRTKESTQEIQQMIGKFRAGTSEAVKVMEQSYRQSQDGRKYAEKAGASFAEITSAVNDINSMNQQIATAAEEQSSVAEEVTQNIHRLNDLVAQVAAGTQQIAGSAEELAKIASESQAEVARFKV